MSPQIPFAVRATGRAAKYQALIGWERATHHRVRHASQVPGSHRAVTTKWLQEVICSNHPGAQVVDFELGTGSSGSSVRRQIVLQYNRVGDDMIEQQKGVRGGLPRSVFGKFTSSATTRLAHSLTGTTLAEACFFNEFRPELDVEAPWGYFAAADARSGRSVQLMEDLVATCGAEFCTPLTTVTRANADEMVNILGTLHGTFQGDARLSSVYRPIKTLPQWYEPVVDAVSLQKYHYQAMDKASAVIPSSVTAKKSITWPMFLEVLALNERLPRTLIHSDVHLANWYRTASGAMGLCDWGCVAKGNGARDLAYALTTALAVDDRRAWERELIEQYIDAAARSGGDRLDVDETMLLYRKHMICALLMWTPTLCHSPLLPDMQPESLSTEMIRRITTAMGDLDSLGAR